MFQQSVKMRKQSVSSIQNQEEEDKRIEQLSLFQHRHPSGGAF